MIEKLLRLRIVAVDDCDHFEELVEGNRRGRGFHVMRYSSLLPRAGPR